MTTYNQNPEQKARDNIDELLGQAGWAVQRNTKIDLNVGLGQAVREYQTDVGPADYVLFVDKKAVGVIEAKREEEGQRLTVHETQTEGYAGAKLKWVNNKEPLPFLYESTGILTRFTDARDPKPRSREVFSFHRPETLKEWLAQGDSLRERLQHVPILNPNYLPAKELRLRDCQEVAINNLETSFKADRPRALIQMATGAGKTYTAITSIYRLLKHAQAKRVQIERAQHYQQQLTDWEASGKQGRKPKTPKTLPPLTAEELAELPNLPEGWGWFLMGDVCLESILGKMLDREKNKGELKPYLRNINVRWGEFDLDDLLEMRFEESEYVRYGLQDGDLVICEGGEPGRCAVWRKALGQDMQFQKALHRVRFTNAINSFFVQLYFERCASNRRLEKMFTGTTIKHLTGEKLARMSIPMCSIDEQAEIVLALESKFSELDQLDQTITTSLQQAEALRQSILKKAFSGQLVPQDSRDEPASALLARIKAEKSGAVEAR